jgi:hypothetical protein
MPERKDDPAEKYYAPRPSRKMQWFFLKVITIFTGLIIVLTFVYHNLWYLLPEIPLGSIWLLMAKYLFQHPYGKEE